LSWFNVLVTDCAWPVLDIEQDILSQVDAVLTEAETGEEPELVRLAPAADAILTTWKSVPPAVLDVASKCRVVSNYGAGIDNIAIEHATQLGIPVTYVPDYCVEEVSDHAMALLLACARRIAHFDRHTRNGLWNRDVGRPMFRLRGQVLGLIGYGNIARRLAPKAHGFGLKIVAYTPYLAPGIYDDYVTLTHDLNALLRDADFVSIHAPLTGETRGMVDAHFLRRMKPTAYLVNTSRGPIVDQTALYRALVGGWIAGACLDVLEQEPIDPADSLLKLDNIIVTPHAAFDSVQATTELQERAAPHVLMALRGETPPHVVNPAVCGQANYRLEHNGSGRGGAFGDL
jgi:D-3-phosphoglycerate dehydrogenase